MRYDTMTSVLRSLVLNWALALVVPSLACASILQVPEDYLTLQDAVDEAAVGDTVSLAAGIHSGPGNTSVSFLGKDITLRGRVGAVPSVIDCDGERGLLLENGESLACVVEDLTIINGYTWYETGGAAIRCYRSSLTIRRCTFLDNVALTGGAIFVYGGTPSISECSFTGNRAREGAGICFWYCASAGVRDCSFAEGRGELGAAIMSSRSSPMIKECTFLNNRSVAYGSGIDIWGTSSASITNCTFVGNRGGSAVIFCKETSPMIAANVFAFNGSRSVVGCLWGASPTITRCVIFANADGDSLCGSSFDNAFLDPLLCEVHSGNLMLCSDSPCLPENNTWGELVGAEGAGCGPCSATVVIRGSWARLKELFRGRSVCPPN